MWNAKKPASTGWSWQNQQTIRSHELRVCVWSWSKPLSAVSENSVKSYYSTKISEGRKFTASAKIDSLNHLQSSARFVKDLLLTVSPAFWCDDTVWVVQYELDVPVCRSHHRALFSVCHFAFAMERNIKTTTKMVMSCCAIDLLKLLKQIFMFS